MTAICENRAGGCTDSSRKIYFPSLQRTLANRNYAKLWYGQAASTTGDAVFGTALVLWVSQVLARGAPWAPAAVSGILVAAGARSEEHTSELQSQFHLVCRLLLEKKKK